VNILQNWSDLKKIILVLTLILPLNGCSNVIQTEQEKKLIQDTCASWINNSLSINNINILINISNNFKELAKIDEIYSPVATASDELVKIIDLLSGGELFGKDREKFTNYTNIIFSACNGQIKIKK
jgi:hypothetical protein